MTTKPLTFHPQVFLNLLNRTLRDWEFHQDNTARKRSMAAEEMACAWRSDGGVEIDPRIAYTAYIGVNPDELDEERSTVHWGLHFRLPTQGVSRESLHNSLEWLASLAPRQFTYVYFAPFSDSYPVTLWVADMRVVTQRMEDKLQGIFGRNWSVPGTLHLIANDSYTAVTDYTAPSRVLTPAHASLIDWLAVSFPKLAGDLLKIWPLS